MSPFRIALSAVLLSLCLPALLRAGDFPDDWFFPVEPAQRAALDKLVGKPAPPIELTEWKNGEVTAEDMKGKIVVVDIWATWCGPCIAAIPHNNEMMEKFADKGVLIVGVCSHNRGQEKLAQVVEQKGIKYPVGKDSTLAVQKAFGVMFYPTYAVVDRAGIVRAIGLTPDGAEKVVEKLLTEGSSADAGAPAAGAAVRKEWLEGDRARFKNLEGKPLASLDLANWTNSEPLTPEALKGRVVLIDFWATWCGPCIASIPHTNELMDKYGPQGLTIIGVCHPKGAETMTAMVKEKGIRYPVAADATGALNKAWKVDGYPDYYLIDRAGNLRVADCKNGKVEEAIQALLAESPATARAD